MSSDISPSSANAAPEPATGADDRLCPSCDYPLAGLPVGTMRCPECGGALSARTFALAAARRIARSRTARLALLGAPGVGIIGGIPIMMIRRAAYDWGLFLFLCLWAGGTIAVYFSVRRTRRRLGRAICLGLPLGIAYFVAVLTIAAGIVLMTKVLGEMM